MKTIVLTAEQKSMQQFMTKEQLAAQYAELLTHRGLTDEEINELEEIKDKHFNGFIDDLERDRMIIGTIFTMNHGIEVKVLHGYYPEVGDIVKATFYGSNPKYKGKVILDEITAVISPSTEPRIAINFKDHDQIRDYNDWDFEKLDQKKGEEIIAKYRRDISLVTYEVDYVPDPLEYYNEWPEPWRTIVLEAFDYRNDHFDDMAKDKLKSFE
jgi:hypothetical protein